jgi:hypothetical protein
MLRAENKFPLLLFVKIKTSYELLLDFLTALLKS